MRNFLLYLSILLLIFSCASGHRNTSAEIRRLVVAGQFDEAIAYLKASSLATDEKSKLLLYTELGLIQHYRGDYAASSLALTSAKAIIDELFTTRISGKLSSFAGNDNSDFYYGEKYEASLVYFYLALNNYMLAVNEVDPVKRKLHLLRARAEVVDWDSFLSEIKKERLGQALFKEDLLAKVFGGFVHESQGTKADDQVALQLYKDAQDVFFKNYNLFPSFNTSYETFRKNFDSFPNLPVAEVEGKYVLKTEHSEVFKEFLKSKIEILALKIKKGKHSHEGSISFLIQDGLIAEKVPNLYQIPMLWGANQSAAISMGLGQQITFELPTIQGVEKLEAGKIQALNATGIVVKEVNLSVVAPLGELAEQAVKEHSASIATKTAIRVTTKHIAALVASAVAYESGRRNNNSMAMLFAVAGHAAAVAGINQSEKADVRFWSTLPSSIRMGYMSLPAGIYKFQAVYDSGVSKRIVDLGTSTISAENAHFVMDNKDLRYKGLISAEPTPISMAQAANADGRTTNQIATNTVVLEKKNTDGCMKDVDCPGGTVCATVRGEYPGSCAGTGFLGGIGRNLSGGSSKSHCSTDSDCSEGKVCATVRGEYPGWCASR